MIDRDHRLPLACQGKAVGVSRGSLYYQPRPVSDADLRLMRRIDELHLEHPFAGGRMLRDMLRHEGLLSGRRHVSTLMRRMGIEALYRKPNTSRRHPRPPCISLPATRACSDQAQPAGCPEPAEGVWAMDITYVPMARGSCTLS